MSALRKTIFYLFLFSIAMGYLEASVVIYLRTLFYPNGFQFPLVPITPDIAVVEFLREAATIVMLICIGAVAGKNAVQRFSLFIFCFAVWDIFYYVFLKIFAGWPSSLLTWDILFIIPVPWVGPVLAPCVISLTMILLTLVVVYFHERDVHVNISIREWFLLSVGSFLVVSSFMWDYVVYILNNGDTSIWTPMSGGGLFSEVSHYIPQSFNWVLFIAGELFLLWGIFLIMHRHRQSNKAIEAYG